VARGTGGQSGTRNTPSLVNEAFFTTFSWEGRNTTLETQTIDPFVNSREQGLPSHAALSRLIESDPEYDGALQRIKWHKLQDRVARTGWALACFVRSLFEADSAFDQSIRKDEASALSEAQRRGLQLFRGRARCATCHLIEGQVPSFTDNEFHAVHIEEQLRRKVPELVALVKAVPLSTLTELIVSQPDVAALGRFLVTLDPADIGRFRTPSLRNVSITGPYMHDGSVATLALAVEREVYYRSLEVSRPISLTPSERDDLVAFLDSLTSSKYAARSSSGAGGTPPPPP
jgi:cytochrome c peroxidase